MRLTRFVSRGGEAYAAYYAMYSTSHPDAEVDMLISLGAWGEGAEADQRAAFYCRVRVDEENYEAMLDDVADSPWSHAVEMGRPLSREQALAHADKKAAFAVLDEAFAEDPSLRGFMQRVACGDLAAPLEHSWRMPDALFALSPEEREARTKAGRHFAQLDGERFFVRCLLPVPVETYGIWSIGIWVEVSQSAHDAVWNAWDVPDEYTKLSIEGRIANDGEEHDLPIPLGAEVRFHAPDPSQPPQIASSSVPSITRLLSETWPQEAFEAHAAKHGRL